MIKQIIRDIEFLKTPSLPASPKDSNVIKDLLDTFTANKEKAVGMAANMIGYRRKIIVVKFGTVPLIMINPEILQKRNSYRATEGCLSLFGERETIRYEEIEVRYLDRDFKPQQQIFTNFIAEVIQHEIDHNNGVII